MSPTMNAGAGVQTNNNVLGVEIIPDDWEEAKVEEEVNLSGGDLSRDQSFNSQMSCSRFLK